MSAGSCSLPIGDKCWCHTTNDLRWVVRTCTGCGVRHHNGPEVDMPMCEPCFHDWSFGPAAGVDGEQR